MSHQAAEAAVGRIRADLAQAVADGSLGEYPAGVTFSVRYESVPKCTEVLLTIHDWPYARPGKAPDDRFAAGRFPPDADPETLRSLAGRFMEIIGRHWEANGRTTVAAVTMNRLPPASEHTADRPGVTCQQLGTDYLVTEEKLWPWQDPRTGRSLLPSFRLTGSRDVPDATCLPDGWQPVYEPWRHGGWYVVNVRYPGGAVGCVSRNYPDRKWRIVCDQRPDAHEKHTYRTRDDAARAERDLARARWERVTALAAALAPAHGPGTRPNGGDAQCAACGAAVRQGKGRETAAASGPRTVVLDLSCAEAIRREQDDPGGATIAPARYAQRGRASDRSAAKRQRTEASEAYRSRPGNGR